MTVSVAIDPEALQQVSQGVCQVGRSAKVYFARHGEGGGGQHLASLTGFVASAFAAIAPPARQDRLMLWPTLYASMLLGLSGLVLLLVTVRPDEHRGVRVGPCLAVSTAIFVWLTDRTPEADCYERQWRSRDPATLPAVDAWVATYDEERPILVQTILGLKQLDWPPDKLHIFVLDDGRRA
jgi:hypothetical protein